MQSLPTLPDAVTSLIDEFSKLPGIGPKTAARLTFHMLRAETSESLRFAKALTDLKQKVRFCNTCFNISETPECLICQSAKRSGETICVVSDPLDIVALEKTHDFRGLYHVLHGEISPLNGVGPGQLRIAELKARVEQGSVEELILATNPTMEGETTAVYIAKMFTHTPLRITRIARGLPVGGDLEYADEVTLSNALAGRREFSVG